MFKDLFDKGKCMVGLHQGEWSYVSQTNCAQIFVCDRCNAQQQRVEHTWDEWAFTEANKCEQLRRCSRCDVEEHRFEHSWQEPQYKQPGACQRIELCNRCGAENSSPEEHIWEEWQYLAESDCAQVQICNRCRAQSSHLRAAHLWDEWEYSEEHRGAVRWCRRCGSLGNKAGEVIGKRALFSSELPPSPTTTKPLVNENSPTLTTEPGNPSSAVEIYEALGNSIFYEEFKGDFALARQLAEKKLKGLRHRGTPEQVADLLLATGSVYLMQGELNAADECFGEVEELTPGDTSRCLSALSGRLQGQYERYNTYPDRNGAGATEINARWDGVADLKPLDQRWHQLMRETTDLVAQNIAWLRYAFLCNLQPARYSLEVARNTPSTIPIDQMLNTFLEVPFQIKGHAESAGNFPLVGFVDLVAGDLCRHAGDSARSEYLLNSAGMAYGRAGDLAGSAICLMTHEDWQSAQLSSPLNWNFALSDSSSQGNQLAFTIEAREFKGGVQVSYTKAEELFRQANVPRGLAAIQLRCGYQAALKGNWEGAAECAIRASEGYQACGDWRGFYLAQTHLVMCRLAGARKDVDTQALTAEIGEWGKRSGSFSYTLGLGILLNRFARFWMVRHGDYERALACSRAAQSLFESLGATVNTAQCLVDQGIAYQAVGERNAASTFYEQALDRYTHCITDHPAIANNLRQRVLMLATDLYQLYLQQTDTDGMERSAARLKEQLNQFFGGGSVEASLTPLAENFSATLLGNGGERSQLNEGLPVDIVFWSIRQMAQSVIEQAAVLVPLYRSRQAKAAGDERGVQKHLDQATAALQGVSGDTRYFLTTVVLAEKKEYQSATEAFENHLAAGGADAGFVGKLTEVMKGLGGEYGQAEALLQRRRTHEQAFSVFVRTKSYSLAQTHLQAIEQLAGKDWWMSDAKPWLPLCDCGEMYEGLGELDNALACYDQAIEQLEMRRTRLSRDELKTALASDKGAQYLYFFAARAALKSGDDVSAFTYTERGKARALLDLMAGTRINSSASENEAMRAWRQVSARLSLRRGLLAQARAASQPEADRIALLTEQIAGDEEQLRQVEKNLAKTNPDLYLAINPQTRTMTLDEVRATLRPKTALLEYFFLGDDLLAWAITPEHPVRTHHAPVEATALARQIRAFHRACERQADYEELAGKLAARLLEPLAEAIRASQHLIIVPYGAAHTLPFQALPFDGEPLAAKRSISFLPSASVLQFFQTFEENGLPERILVVGNPTKDLPAAETEAEFVASLFKQPSLLLREEATETVVRELISDCPLLHFATHGNLSEAAPLDSSISLANGDEITVYELMGLQLKADLVALSACNTAQGETTGGDDVLGLTRGLLAAGARAAVVSLWPVDDDSTGLLMGHFYRSLRSGDPPGRALQSAQNYLRTLTEDEIKKELESLNAALEKARTGQGIHRSQRQLLPAVKQTKFRAYNHPYYWAPFILVG